jgi:hypothetical protein
MMRARHPHVLAIGVQPHDAVAMTLELRARGGVIG